MKRLSVALIIVILANSSLACTGERLQEARAGVENAVAQLPTTDSFETIAVTRTERSATAYGRTCYYGIAIIMIGTMLPQREALETYVQQLESLGWQLRGRQHEASRVLLRDRHELATVSYSPFEVEAGWELQGNSSGLQDRIGHTTILVLWLQYMLPARDDC